MNALEDDEFRGFVAARGTALLRTAYLLTGDQQLAEDLVQTALERAVAHWGSIRVVAAAEAYVRRTMYREQVSLWRRRGQRVADDGRS
jgi:DNA-directed RNA polymerase specialized sigma24 family protein